MRLKSFKTYLVLASIVLTTGCATQQTPYDYSAFERNNPASILVLPPVNTSPDVKASYSVLSHVTAPLAEAGYYVLPVAVVDETFKQNGLMNADEMHMAPPAKLREIFGADAALYIEVSRYGSSYKVITSEVAVEASGKLVDLRSGDVLWEGSALASTAENQNNSGGGLVGMLISAAVNQVLNSLTDRSHEVAGIASSRLLSTQRYGGILSGPRSPLYKQAQLAHR
ncbi:DUF799 domain-containing protein [Pseudomonas sp. PS1]|uniref:DUF799 domain-containing protein n=1 Tax=Stutzerimonas marianensis TaxID=2929513 RepID=A0A9X1W749_9GAMM|nr:DUF799 domain-containing protein [Pseudomonas marianensis]MCJ0976047.1 DUF799 domain-containing protein [Pseudomonas marianensis]